MSKRARSSDRDEFNRQDKGENKGKSASGTETGSGSESGQESKQKKARVTTFSPWTRLPSVLLEKICQHRNSCQQHKQFAKTCKTFQNAAKKPGSWHGQFNVISKSGQSGQLFNPAIFKLYLADQYMTFIAPGPAQGQQTSGTSGTLETLGQSHSKLHDKIKRISRALSGVKVLTFEIEPKGKSSDYPVFFADLFQNLNFKQVKEVVMEAPLDVVALYNAASKGECKKLTHVTMSVDLYTNAKQVHNAHSMLVKSLKYLVLQAPVWENAELGIDTRSDEFKMTTSAELPMLERLFMENIFVSSAATSKFNLFRITSCKRLSKLTLFDCSFQSPQDLAAVSSTLKILIIKRTESSYVPTDENLTQVVLNTPNLTELDLDLSDYETPVAVQLFMAISSLKHLQNLAISNAELEFSSDFSHLQSLTSLDITADTNADVVVFPATLKQLMWRSEDGETSKKVIVALPSCTNLEYLELDDPIFPRNRDCLAHLVKLNAMVLRGLISIDHVINDWKSTENGFFNLPKTLVHLELYNTHASYEEDANDELNQQNQIVLEFIKSAIECKCPIVHLVTDHNTVAVLKVMRHSALQLRKWILPIKRWETFWLDHEDQFIPVRMPINVEDSSFLMNEMKTLEQVKITYNSYKMNLHVQLFMHFLPSSVTTLEISSQHDPMLLSLTEKQINIGNPKLANRHLIYIANSILRLDPVKLPKLSSIKLFIKFNLETEPIKNALNDFIEEFLQKILVKWKTLQRKDIDFIPVLGLNTSDFIP